MLSSGPLLSNETVTRAGSRQGPGGKSSVRGAGFWLQGSRRLALALVLNPHPAWALSAVLEVG